MKTYVVIGSCGKWDEHIEDVVYAGNDKNKAESFDIDGHYEELSMLVWSNGIQIQTFHKDNKKWKLTFDKTSEIKNQIEKLKQELEQLAKVEESLNE